MISFGLGRLDERKRRKEFILERNLLYPNHFEKDLSPEERALCRRYDVFMRFHSKEEHEDLLQTVISEHRTLKRIQELKVLVTCFATLNLRCYLISYSHCKPVLLSAKVLLYLNLNGASFINYSIPVHVGLKKGLPAINSLPFEHENARHA